MVSDKSAREAIEQGSQPSGANPPDGRYPSAGPHAKAHLTDYDKTPGTGSLPSKDGPEADTGPD